MDFNSQDLLDGLPWWLKTFVRTMAVSDYAVRTSASTAMVASSLPYMNKILSKENTRGWEYYTQPELFRDPGLFFKRPDVPPGMKKARVRMKGFKDAVVEELSVKSPFQPSNPNFQPLNGVRYKDMPDASARSIRHGDGNRPTIICMHGFLFDDHELMSYFFGARGYYDMGFDLLLYTSPFHGPRRIKNALYNGDGFFLLDAGTINENVAYTIHDLRLFIGYLKETNPEKIGISGISLGGYHSALATDIDERIDFSINKIPIVSMWDLVLSWEPSGTLLRMAMARLKFTNEQMRGFMAIHSPLSHKPRIHPDDLFMVGAKGDQMVPVGHTIKLWEHWGRPEIYWYPGTHIVHSDRNAYLKSINRFLKKHI